MSEKLKVGEKVALYNPQVLMRFDCNAVVAIVQHDTSACYILDVTYPPHADGEKIFITKVRDK